MVNTKIRDYIIDFQKSELPQIIPRELVIKPRESLACTIIGPRRAGKTYYFYQIIKALPRTKVLYLNFEDTRLINLTFEDFLDVVNLHTELVGERPEWIFLDEPQNIGGWERGVRTLLDKKEFKIVITGSSSKLLAKEVATQLRGRAITHLLLPYSFKEFLAAQGAQIPRLISSSEAAKLRSYLNTWLEWGGYPEVVKTEDVNEKMKILDSYKDLIIYKDIIERYKIKSPFFAKLLIDQLMSSFTKEFSVNALFNVLKSKNIKISKKTLYSYLSLVEDSMTIFLLEKWSPKLKEQRLSPKKVYLCDTGLVYRQKEDKSKLMENAVFLQLKRLQNLNPMLEIFYWKDHQQHEVDFVLKKGRLILKLIQVSYVESKGDVREREVANLLAAAKELKPKSLEVITWSYENAEIHNDKKITFIPLWKWLLSFSENLAK